MSFMRLPCLPLPMTCLRSTLISLTDTPWYHIVARCVRRAFLCGEDHFTGKSFEHRRGWLEAWVLRLAGLFAIDIAVSAVTSNHYHIVLRVDADRAAVWNFDEVLKRWTALSWCNATCPRSDRP